MPTIGVTIIIIKGVYFLTCNVQFLQNYKNQKNCVHFPELGLCTRWMWVMRGYQWCPGCTYFSTRSDTSKYSAAVSPSLTSSCWDGAGRRHIDLRTVTRERAHPLGNVSRQISGGGRRREPTRTINCIRVQCQAGAKRQETKMMRNHPISPSPRTWHVQE